MTTARKERTVRGYTGPTGYDDTLSLAVAGYLKLLERGVPRGVTVASFRIQWRYDNLAPDHPQLNLWRFSISAFNARGKWAG